MAALLWTFIITYFGNTICVNNASSDQVNVTHIVSKDTFVFDKAFNLTGSKENATSAPPRVSSTEQSAEAPGSDGGVGTESSTFRTTETFTATDLQTTETSLSPTEGILVTANPKTERGGISSRALPLSGSLPQPVTEVSAVCPCNVQRERCDINCCCDPDCTQELALFTQCSVQKVVGDTKLCSQDAALYTLTAAPDGLSQVTTSVQREINPDVFCIQSANYEQGMSFLTPMVPTEDNFDSLFDRFVGFFFRASGGDGRALQTQGNSPGYMYGDLIQTMDDAEQRGFFRLPASAAAANCLDTNPAAFLKDQTSRCVRSFAVKEDCTVLDALNLEAYTNFRVFSGKDNGANLVSVEVETITLQSLEGTRTLLQTDAVASNYTPVLNGQICNQVVLQVKYTVRFDDAGQIVTVTASFVLGAVDESTLPIQQEFQITFVQEIRSDATLRSSGNPGYVVGLPLVAGWRTAEGIIRSSDPDGSLTVIKSSAEQDCLLGVTQRSPILFGIDVVSGCTFRLEDSANCSLLSEVILGRLKGQIFPDYVASFGNSSPQNPMDWVPLENQTTPTATQGCSIPVSYHLEVSWTKYGTLLNPQAQIVKVMETIQTNTSTLPSLSTSGVISVMSSVSFIDVSESASPGFRVPPTINANLPSNFFFPFV
ncbi:tectonic-1 [Hemibagrus wyckioides]|uniref:tectonic-1 n=1 Tax=Hemibagrus wyckioides TaxID=337641 RepID=UPI00266BE093|nr:tectonic-1 [Hemibagrus wyckioides]